MLIDNSLRRRWGFIPHQSNSSSEEELITDSDLGINLASNRELQHKFRVSAEEWLGTWRVTE